MSPLPSAIVLSAALAIASGLAALPAWILFVAKPLTTALLCAFAWARGQDEPRARRFVLIGLGFSLAGDVFLLWPTRGFLPGLVAFLLAHLAYIAAFSTKLRFLARRLPFAGYAAVAGAILAALWPGVPPGLRMPVVLYVLCLASMAAQAAAVWRAARGSADEVPARCGAIGGALFVASDALLAINKFAAPVPLSALWILTTYWLAQWFIATSLRRGHG